MGSIFGLKRPEDRKKHKITEYDLGFRPIVWGKKKEKKVEVPKVKIQYGINYPGGDGGKFMDEITANIKKKKLIEAKKNSLKK